MNELVVDAVAPRSPRHLAIVRCTGCGGDHPPVEVHVEDAVHGPYFVCGGRRVYLVRNAGVPRGTK